METKQEKPELTTQSALGAVSGSAPNPRIEWELEASHLQTAVEDMWQATQEWMEDGDGREANYFATRCIGKLCELIRHNMAEVTQEPNENYANIRI